MNHAIIPFRQFVLKVHSRCNLACDYCYVYEHADQSWRGRPVEMSRETTAQVGFRIAEHAAAHDLSDVVVVLHGGEPLLLGVDRMRETLGLLRDAISRNTKVRFAIHTNGALLTESYLELFAEYDVRVGVSIDGDRAANDRHRRYRDGRSSYDRVLAGLALLREPRHRPLWAGLLCVVDIGNDPVQVYRGLLAQEPPQMDLLMPHSNWQTQPPGLRRPRDLRHPSLGDGEYSDWFTAVFDAWNSDGRPVPIRTFDSLLAAMYGRPSSAESFGLDPVDLLVIETEGTLEQVDSLKTAYPGAAATGMDVWRNSLDEAAVFPAITVRQIGADGVSAVCRSCPVVQACGGGFYPDRYHPDHGFDNPSVFCADLKEMVEHIMDSETAAGRGGAQSALPATESAHTLSADQFAQLAAGFGDASTVDWLVQAQISIRRELLAAVGRFGPQHDEHFTAAWDLLVSLDATAPEAVEQVLAHPYTRVWAGGLLEDIGRGEAVAADTRHMEAVAAAVALRAGKRSVLPVPVRGGVAPLPTFGALRADTQDRVWIDTGSPEDIDLVQPLRRMTATGLTVTLEDTDPYRFGHEFVSDRLTDAAAEEWQRIFGAAIDFIDEHLPVYASGMRAGLRTVMPMVADGHGRSASVRLAFGAVGVGMRTDPALTAMSLVHEFQHVKMGATLDLFELFDLSDTQERLYAPWRPDPRPLEGLLQGSYAHIGVTDVWRALRTVRTGDEREEAERQFARWRIMTAEAIRRVLDSGSLTPLGERFVRAMGDTVEPWLTEYIPPDIEAAARCAAEKHRAVWEARVAAGQR
ncbi:MAG: chuR 2 [Nocardia sp.]|uniref:FxsB family cyclophane-forming radical SAM/SPASM peptide maturase n=1 Tax=Nocardia sp. TaxID=1821 RepID=UPI0026107B8C|nr:FxsB family cyclophane-forming radical SAM/SPASM peptide maturase [Nocardia sp.]MCU1644067.1 chuR 2 [Nocardia sp.]